MFHFHVSSVGEMKSINGSCARKKTCGPRRAEKERGVVRAVAVVISIIGFVWRSGKPLTTWVEDHFND